MINRKIKLRFTKPGIKAFTLIELLVVIAIIGVLSTLVIVALGNSRTSARDAKRLNDLKAMANALELYFADNNQYPASITPGQPLEQGGVVYMNKVPENPTPRTDGICPDSEYTYTAIAHKPGHYQFSGCIGSSSGSFTAGPVSYQTDSGVINCGGQITDADGNVYNTVQIGSQCWMKENMNIGTMVDAAQEQGNDEVIEKYCYQDNLVHCDTYGGLYQWTEAMNLSYGECISGSCVNDIQTPHQGICPDGFHIPTDVEWNVLEQHTVLVINSIEDQYSCNTSVIGHRRCGDNNGTDPGGPNGAGRSLKKVGVSTGDDLVGFSLLLPGYRLTGGTISNVNSRVRLWSATEYAEATALIRYTRSGYSTVSRLGPSKTEGYSVRCLKD